ncbi:class I adenylate-forming enzyme family protein [Stigmatella hybrida]|uniref:class I adenylate-forming enzyme family protein n=1 Tax=Stigmatella hybrida TaxID=394097 RepID=UPI001CDA75D1|nr:class I adenylate-forming enzyme family protein [Stigmatella hybrida]
MDWVRTRPFNRLRFTLDSTLTLANVADKASAAHHSGAVFYLQEPLPYSGLPERSVSAKEMLGFINRLGNVLLAAGLKRFDRVALYKTHSPDYFFLGLAIVKAGGIAVPINPRMPHRDLRNYLAHTGARFVITDPETFTGGVQELAPSSGVEKWLFTTSPGTVGVPSVVLSQELPRASDQLQPVELASDSDVMIVHTSGTTGFPKGVLIGNSGIMSALRANLAMQPFSRKNKALFIGPYNHYATYLGMMTSLVGGAPVWVHSQFDAESVLKTIERERISVFVGFPDSYLKMYHHGLDKYDLGSMRAWMSAADASHEVHIRAFTQHGALFRVFGRPVIRAVFVDAWGTSELGFFGLSRISTSGTKQFSRCIGRPSPFGHKVKIADETGRELKPGQVGRFMVKGPMLFKGYWNAHDRLHGVFIDGWWWTGDVGYRDGSGRFFQLDRAVDVVETRQGPVYTLPIEEQLLKLPEVGEAVVIGVPDADGSTVPSAVIQLNPGMTADADELLRRANQKLEAKDALRRIVFVDESQIPRGLTGKVLKRQVRERFAHLLVGERPQAAVA